MPHPSDGNDRRRHPRLKVRHVQGTYHLTREMLGRLFRIKGKSGTAVVMDISMGGIGLLLDKPPSLRSELKLETVFLGHPVQLKGRVVRIRSLQNPNLYETGLRVDDPPQALIAIILRLQKKT